MVERHAERADHLRHAAPGEPAQQLHLRQPQVRVHEAEGDRQIVVGRRLDIGELMGVPVDGDLGRERGVARQCRQPLGEALRARRRSAQRAREKAQRHQRAAHAVGDQAWLSQRIPRRNSPAARPAPPARQSGAGATSAAGE